MPFFSTYDMDSKASHKVLSDSVEADGIHAKVPGALQPHRNCAWTKLAIVAKPVDWHF